MKNESNTGNSQRAIRKNCTLALSGALLSTLLFTSAAHGQSNCAYSQIGGNWAALCPTTSTSGSVWVDVNGTWDQLLYFTTDATFTYIFHYHQNAWSLENRVTGEQFVLQGATWVPYADYYSNVSLALFSLATLAQATGNTGADVTSSAPTITIVPKNEVAELCGYGLFWQQYYQDRGYTKVPLGSMCGQ